MDEEREKQIQELTDKIYNEVKATEEKAVEEKAPAEQEKVQDPDFKKRLKKSLILLYFGILSTLVGYLVTYKVLNPGGCEDSLSCGQAIGWTLIIFGPLIALAIITVLSIGLTGAIYSFRCFKEVNFNQNYSSYLVLFYIGIVLYIITFIASIALLFPIIGLFLQ